MRWNKVVEAGRKVVEAGVERALVAANAAEQVGRRAARGYNCLAERAPFPLPRIPLGGERHEEEISPPSPPAPHPNPVVTTTSLMDEPALRVAAAEVPATPVTRTAASKAPKAAPKAPKAAPKAPKAAPKAPKAAPKAPKAAKPAPAAKGEAPIPAYNTMLKKMRKSQIQELATALGIPFTDEESAPQLATKIRAFADAR